MSQAIAAAIAGGVTLLLWWLSSRRKDRAAGAVAERTVNVDVESKQLDVELKDIAADDARLVSAAKAWETRAAGLIQSIQDRDQVVEWQRGELRRRDELLEHREQVIADLRQQLDQAETQLAGMTRQLAEMTRQFAACRDRLDHLEEERNTQP